MGTPKAKRRALAPAEDESPSKKPYKEKKTNKSPSKEGKTPTTDKGGKNTLQIPEPTTPRPKTPKTPGSAKLLGTKKSTATAVRSHATASNTLLHRMLEALMDVILEKQPQSTEERNVLLDSLAKKLVDIGFFSLLHTIRIRNYSSENPFPR
jgi:hypothetical protein